MTDPWDLLTVSVEPTNGHAPPPPPADQAQTAYRFKWGKYKPCTQYPNGWPIEAVPESTIAWYLENLAWLQPGNPKFDMTTWEIFRRRLGLSALDEQLLNGLKEVAKAKEKAVKAEKTLESKQAVAGLSEGLRRAIRGWYSTMARRYHPDHGGSEVQQVVVNACYQELVKTLDAWEKKT